MRAFGTRTILATALALAGPAGPAAAATFAVDATVDAVDAAPGDGVCATTEGTCTLRAAVMEANAFAGPDEVVLAAGVYFLDLQGADENEAASGDLDLQGDVTVRGAGMDLTVVRGDGTDRIFDVHAPATVTISGLTIRDGGGVTNGGGLRSREGDVTLDGVRVTAVRASEAGVAVVATGPLRIVNGDLDGTDSGGSVGDGAAIRAFDALTVEASRIANWTEPTVVNGTAALTIVDSTVERNDGQYLIGGGVPLVVRGSTFSENSGTYILLAGGAATIENSAFLENSDCIIVAPKDQEAMTIAGSRFEDNTCATIRDRSLTDAEIVIHDTLFARNQAAYDSFTGTSTISVDGLATLEMERIEVLNNNGGVSVGAKTGVTVKESRFEGNLSRGLTARVQNQAAILIESSDFIGNEVGLRVATSNQSESTATIRDCEIRDNEKKPGSRLESHQAGGLIVDCDATLETGGTQVIRSRIVGNAADAGAAIRGASYDTCLLRVAESEIRGNAGGTAAIASGDLNATFDGSLLEGNASATGADIDVDGSVTLLNTTWTESGPDPSPFLFVRDGRTASIEHSTLAQLTASSTPILEVDGDVTVTGSILYDQGIGCDGLRVLASGGHNLVFAANCGLDDASDMNGVDPLLDALADRGGPTETFALLPGSPAVGAIPAEFCPETDQRGWRRVGDACAVGAFEPDAVPCTDADGDGFFAEGDLCGPADCDDANAGVNPGALEIPGNEIDEDCDPLTPAGCMVEVTPAEAAATDAPGRSNSDASLWLVAALAASLRIRSRRGRHRAAR